MQDFLSWPTVKLTRRKVVRLNDGLFRFEVTSADNREGGWKGVRFNFYGVSEATPIRATGPEAFESTINLPPRIGIAPTAGPRSTGRSRSSKLTHIGWQSVVRGYLSAVSVHLCRDVNIPLRLQILNVPACDSNNVFTPEGRFNRVNWPYESYREIKFIPALPTARMTYLHKHPGSASTSIVRGGLENQLYASFQLRSRASPSVHSGNGPSTRRRRS
ncbi:hypothetical protein AFLA_009349 [Aspergillus flavus NRRL3357]|nr:hypothetical protein AFLA_009349 [Aspergillus flavus NRRL3357]